MAGLVPAIDVLIQQGKDVDARDKPGHDEFVDRPATREAHRTAARPAYAIALPLAGRSGLPSHTQRHCDLVALLARADIAGLAGFGAEGEDRAIHPLLPDQRL